MNRNQIRLAERRKYLIAQAAIQRNALAEQIEPWRSALNLADRGLSALRHVNIPPAVFVGGVIVLAVIPAGPVRKWLWRCTREISSLFWLWAIYRTRAISP